MGLFGRLAQARTGYLTGQMQGQDDQRQLAEAERQRTRQDQQDFSAQAIAALNKRILAAQAQAAEQAAMTPKPPAAWKPTTMDEAVQYEQQLADARAAAQAKHRAPPVPKGQGGQGGQPGVAPTVPPMPKPGKAPKDVAVSESERRGAALLTVARNALPVLKQATAPGRWEAFAARHGVNEGLSADRQVLEQAASQAIGAYLYAVSGATAGPEEMKARIREVVPQPGETDQKILERKRQALGAYMKALEVMAGRAEPMAGGSGDLDFRRDAPMPEQAEMDDLAKDYQDALREGADPAEARKEYDAAVMAVARKHGRVK